ncbi:MAG: DNA-binding protein [Bacteroidetes bacterium RIFCSPLOWO2_12_FULL_31_6]|nr:MAG: DNA-binding protein [Bacteroidetes bacterium RIFCSPLOWO2_12_FULL_31_6]
MEQIQFLNVTPNELKQEITKEVINHLDKFFKDFKPKQPNEYLTRLEVAKMFSVDISTISNWQKSKRLKPLAIGARVYFLRSDIEQSLTYLNS